MTISYEAGKLVVIPEIVLDPVVITDRAEVARLAALEREDTEAFGHYIAIVWEREGRSDAELDALVEAVAVGVEARVDCTLCANCCRSMTVGLTPDDIPRLAVGLGQDAETVVAQLIDREKGQAMGEWGVMRRIPCPLLRESRRDGPDGSPHQALCSAYDHRPGACRAYPGLIPDFRWLYDVLAADAGECPIIYNVIEQLKRILDWQPTP